MCGDYTGALRDVVAERTGADPAGLPLERSWDFHEWGLSAAQFENLHQAAVMEHRIFRTMQDLGFDIPTYMSNTVFPIPVDIRCFDNINAHCVGDGMGGIGHAGYGLMDTTDLANPLGRA